MILFQPTFYRLSLLRSTRKDTFAILTCKNRKIKKNILKKLTLWLMGKRQIVNIVNVEKWIVLWPNDVKIGIREH